jgi:hypothetical protein
MRRLSIGIMLGILTVRASAAWQPDAGLEQELSDVLRKQASGPCDLSEEQRQRLLDYLAGKVEGIQSELRAGGVPEGDPKYDVPRDDMLSILIQLGEENAIMELTDDEVMWGYREFLLVSGSPIAIQRLSALLFREESFEQRQESDVTIISPSFLVAGDFLPFALSRSPAFNGEVINWARERMEMKRGGHWEEIREEMRRWWRDNEPKFMQRQYKAVAPPRGPERNEAATVNVGPSSVTSGTSTFVEIADSSSSSVSMRLVVAVCTIALIGVAAAAWLRGRKAG